MRRIIIAGVLLTIVIISYISSYIYIDKACEETNRLLEECVDAYKESKNPKSYAEKLENYWSKKEKPLSVVVNHARIDDIESAISSLVVYSDLPENKIFYEYSGTVKTLVHQLMEDTVPSIHSIF